MTPEKIISIIEEYEKMLADVPKYRMHPSLAFNEIMHSEELLMMHAHYLCEGAKACVYSDFGKANRHLTAIQMCLSFAGMFSLDELMNHNRTKDLIS